MKAHLIFATCALLAVCTFLPTAHAETRSVSTMAELRDAISKANPGDVIEVAPGKYSIDSKISIRRSGTKEQPITLRAKSRGVEFESDTVEAFNLAAEYWTIEGIQVKGICADDSKCEHALHIIGGSTGAIIRRNAFINFNAQIKGNGSPMGDVYFYSDDVLIEDNQFYNEASRNTSNPVTPIDVVGGRRWIIRANYIADFHKLQSNKVSYAAFLKGNSRDGLFERNLVVCESRHQGGFRRGLSFGGGGTGPDKICEDQDCSIEHQNGVMRNNIIVNCPETQGIYINEGKNILIEHNTMFNAKNLDVQFEASTVELRHNIISGKITTRNGGTITSQTGNLSNLSSADLNAWFTDPANLDFSLKDGAMFVDKADSSSILADYCNIKRAAPRDIGALEYTSGPTPCDTSLRYPGPLPQDPMGSGDMGGSMMADMGRGGTTQDMSNPNTTQDMNQGGAINMSTPNNQADAGNIGSTNVPANDMGSATQADSGTTTSTPGGGQGTQDDGCNATSGSSPSSPLTLLMMTLGLLGLRRRSATRTGA